MKTPLRNLPVTVHSFFCLTAGGLLFTGLSLSSPPAWSQAYKGEFRYLEDFALRAYQNGEYARAATEFQRILRLDPGYESARQSLEAIKKSHPDAVPVNPGDNTAEKIDVIAQDIKIIKDGIIRKEEETRELESMIRTLITENDHLYMAVNKRSRDVMELREKFYGVPYEDQRAGVFDQLPLERVPQRPFRPADWLSEPDTANNSQTQEAAVAFARAQAEADALTADIIKGETELAGLAPQAAEYEQLKEALDKKRALLLEKRLILFEKKDRLDLIKNRLSEINSDLKDADSRYLALIEKIDHYFAAVKSDIEQKKAADRDAFEKLVTDYAVKVRELEVLKQSISEKEKHIPVAQPAIMANEKDLSEVNDRLSAADREISIYKGLLAEYRSRLQQARAELAEQKISLEKNRVEITDKNSLLTQASARLGQSRVDLEDNQGRLADTRAQLEETLARLKTSDSRLAETVARLDENLKGLQDKETVIEKKNTVIEEKNASIAQMAAVISEKTSQMNSANKMADSVSAQVTDIQSLLNENAQELEKLSSEMSSARKMTVLPAVPVEEKTVVLNVRDEAMDKKYLETARSLEQACSTIKDLDRALEKERAAREEAVAENEEHASLQELTERLRVLERDLTQAGLELGRKDDNIALLHQEVLRHKDEAAGLREAVLQSKNEIKNIQEGPEAQRVRRERTLLHDALFTRDAQVAELRRQLEEKDVEVTRLNAMISDLRSRVEAADIMAGEKALLTRDLNALSRSLSEELLLSRAREAQISALTRLVDEQKADIGIANMVTEQTLIKTQASLQTLQLDLKEKDLALEHTKDVLRLRSLTLKNAQEQIRLFQEKIAVLEIKQQAARNIVDKRYQDLERLEKELETARKEAAELKRANACLSFALKDSKRACCAQ
jgi:chromosome segregation ATPase